MKKNVLSDQLKKLREQKGWSYKTMGKKLGVDYRTIQNYEFGDSQPTADILEDYTRIFHVPFECLYYGMEISTMKLYDEFNKLSRKQQRIILEVMNEF